jgi:rRNA small subunit pseudouridine methyltransferase Nep1
MLALFDSPLAKAGRIQVFIHTSKNVLIKVSHELRVPRTYKRFAGLLTQLLHTRKIKATENNKVLMKVIKNPVTDHLPLGCIKIGTSVESELVKIGDFIKTEKFKFNPKDPNTEPMHPVFVIGVCAYGHPGKEAEYIDTCISISSYHLSAAACVTRITNSFENLWGIN